MIRKIFSWFEPPTFEDREKERLGRLLHYLLLTIIITLSLLFVLMGLTTALNLNIILTLGTLIGVFIIGLPFLKRGYFTQVSLVVVISGFVGIINLLGGENGEGVRDPAVFGFLIVILISSVLLGWQASVLVTLATVSVLWWYANLELAGRFEPSYVSADEYTMITTSLIVIVAALLYLLDTGLRNAANLARESEESLRQSNQELKELQIELEQRVQARTMELETSNKLNLRRAAQLEVITQVARDISATRDLETLLSEITKAISESFGHYHVGIFLLDDDKQFAVLRAANSPGGGEMLAQEHKLKVGETGIVGYVTSRGRARIALDTGSDAVYFDNPHLPETRSEMALPITDAHAIIGALDVQSLEPNAFTQEDIDTLSILADQVGIAIQNANLFEETQEALTEYEKITRQITTSGWAQFAQTKNIAGIRRSKAKSTILTDTINTKKINEENALSLPIVLRGNKIGTLEVQAEEGRKWTQDEIDIANAIIERTAITIENARLLSDAQKREARERTIGEIATRVSASTDMEMILRTAVQELGHRMGGAEVILEIGSDVNTEEKPDE